MTFSRSSAAPVWGHLWRVGAVALSLGAVLSVPAQAAEVGVSVVISQPGVYGRVDIGRFPNPVVVAPQPVVIQPAPRPAPVVMAPAPAAEPVYMWVPPGHRKNWRKHCARYNACGHPVYFVQDGWYRQNVGAPQGAPSGRGGEGEERRGPSDERRGGERGHGHGQGHERGRGHGRED